MVEVRWWFVAVAQFVEITAHDIAGVCRLDYQGGVGVRFPILFISMSYSSDAAMCRRPCRGLRCRMWFLVNGYQGDVGRTTSGRLGHDRGLFDPFALNFRLRGVLYVGATLRRS